MYFLPRSSRAAVAPQIPQYTLPSTSSSLANGGKYRGIEAVDRSFLAAAIYIPTEPGYQARVAEKVTKINDQVSVFHNNRPTNFIACPPAMNYPTDYEFQKYLDIYTNNQQYYLDNRQHYDDNSFFLAVRQLEDWFVQMTEPCFSPEDYPLWLERERKRANRISHYCNPIIRKVLRKRRKN